jgi:hypothetical protein
MLGMMSYLICALQVSALVAGKLDDVIDGRDSGMSGRAWHQKKKQCSASSSAAAVLGCSTNCRSGGNALMYCSIYYMAATRKRVPA